MSVHREAGVRCLATKPPAAMIRRTEMRRESMKLRSALLAATVLAAVPMVAKAQAVSGLYIGAGAGDVERELQYHCTLR